MSETGVCCSSEVLLLFLALSLPAFAHEVYVSAFFAAWRGRTWLAFAARCASFSPAAAAASRFFACCSARVPEHALSLLQAACEHALHVAVQLTAWVAVKIDTRCAGFNT